MITVGQWHRDFDPVKWGYTSIGGIVGLHVGVWREESEEQCHATKPWCSSSNMSMQITIASQDVLSTGENLAVLVLSLEI